MNNPLMSRYTPSLMRHEDLEAVFVQREKLASDLVSRLRDSILSAAKHHPLLVGPRGIGKTHIVALVYHRLKSRKDLEGRFRIAWLREEEWGVGSFLDLLVRVLRALREECPDLNLEQAIEELPGDPRKAERQAEQLLLTSTRGSAVIVLVENLEDLFAGLGERGQKQLRGFLQNHSDQFALLATAQSLFGGVSLRESPFYGFFNIHHLSPLDLEDALLLLRKLSQHEGNTRLTTALDTARGRARVRVLHHLAGGNPRIYVIFGQFLTASALEDLVEPFFKTLDDLTPYYQARMSWLSPQQRKIVESLLEGGVPLTVKEIARRCFITHQTASSQLKSLRDTGYVVSQAEGREVFYELREPLMRLAFAVKRHRGEPVRLLLDFLGFWFTRQELEERLPSFAGVLGEPIGPLEATRFTANPVSLSRKEFERALSSGDFRSAELAAEELQDLEGQFPDWLGPILDLQQQGKQTQALAAYRRVVDRFGDSPEAPLAEQAAKALILSGIVLMQLERSEEALAAFREVVARYEERPELGLAELVGQSLLGLGLALAKLGRSEEELAAYSEVVERFGDRPELPLADPVAKSLFNRGIELGRLGRTKESLAAYREVVRQFGDRPELPLAKQVAKSLFSRGVALAGVGRTEEALSAYSEVVERFADRPELPLAEQVARSLFNCGVALAGVGRTEEALAAYSEVVERFADRPDLPLAEQVARSLFNCGGTLAGVGRTEEALAAYSEVVERFADRSDLPLAEPVAMSLVNRGIALAGLRRAEEALAAFREVVERFGDRPELPLAEQVAKSLVNRGVALGGLGRTEEALAAFREVVERFGDSNAEWPSEAVLRASLLSARITNSLEDFENALKRLSQVPKTRLSSLLPGFAVDILSAFLVLRRTEGIKEFVAKVSDPEGRHALGSALVGTLGKLGDPEIDEAVWTKWLEAWKKAARGIKELEIPLRILEAGIRHQILGDAKARLRLPAEQRKLLEQILDSLEGTMVRPLAGEV